MKYEPYITTIKKGIAGFYASFRKQSVCMALLQALVSLYSQSGAAQDPMHWLLVGSPARSDPKSKCIRKQLKEDCPVVEGEKTERQFI